jgi:hypothetical protein
MGMEYTIQFSRAGVPTLPQILAVLAEQNFPVQVRMVDGELTLPHEVPPDGWKDVRLGTPSGMVTLVRRGEELAVVTWGNADEALRRAWNAVAWATAKAGEGWITGPGGQQSVEEFRSAVPMPEVLQV